MAPYSNRQPTDFKFKHEWHVLRDRNHVELKADTTSEKRNEEELKFFMKDSKWCAVEESKRGVGSLLKRLRLILFSIAKRELPKLREMVIERMAKVEKELEILGGGLELAPPEEIRATVVARLQKMAGDHARGIYEEVIHGFKSSSPLHLRSRIVD